MWTSSIGSRRWPKDPQNLGQLDPPRKVAAMFHPFVVTNAPVWRINGLSRARRATMDRSIFWLTLAIAFASVPTAGAQTGTIEGAVSADSLGKRSVPGAEISIPALKLTAQANFVGEFRLAGIAPGRYLVIATGVGLRSVGDSVTIESRGTTYHDFVLATKAVVLDSVVSKAPAERTHISPALRGFEERRLSGSGGYFVTDSILRREEDRPLDEIVSAHVPGAQFVRPGQNRVYLTSNRLGGHCFTDVYLDGVALAPLPDPDPKLKSIVAVNLSQFVATDLAAIEFYPGGASLPVQFNHTSSGCGALLLWTRER
jgi:hypothetical protein